MNEGPDLNKFLAALLISAAKELTSSIKESIKKEWLKGEYGVTLEPQEGEKLKQISENEFYLSFKRYLRGHWSIKLIKIGIYISELNDEGKRQRAKELQSECYKRYGAKGKKIIQLASTGVLIPVMNYIIDLKFNKDASYFVLSQEFDKILEDWDAISIPINSDSNEDEVINSVKNKMKTFCSIFFVYASGNAARIAQLALAKLNNDLVFQNKYLMTSKNKVINGVDYCLWVFEKVEDSSDNSIYV